MANIPKFVLDEPGTIVFTAERAFAGRAFNRFALSLRRPENRRAFLDQPSAYMATFGIDDRQIELVIDRDWTGLLLSGGHLQAVLKLAATVGKSLWDIGAHSVGVDVDELKNACPRRVSGLPAGGK